MKYDLSNSEDREQALSYLKKLAYNEKKIELKEIKKKRSLSHNAYFHVVITLYSIAYGCTLYEAKTDLKRAYGLYYERNGNKYLMSSADLDSKVMSAFIDYIRTKASKDLNTYIPTSEEYLIDQYNIDKEINRNKEYL
jgi:phage terminase large subunit GpA-like protein